MDEETKPADVHDAVPPTGGVPHTGSVSRRDFLRRASKEAVQTGVSLMPGAAVAKVVLGGTEKDGTKKPSLGERWAAWRSDRLAETNTNATPTTKQADGEAKP